MKLCENWKEIYQAAIEGKEIQYKCPDWIYCSWDCYISGHHSFAIGQKYRDEKAYFLWRVKPQTKKVMMQHWIDDSKNIITVHVDFSYLNRKKLGEPYELEIEV
jgi:hypothetical protein